MQVISNPDSTERFGDRNRSFRAFLKKMWIVGSLFSGCANTSLCRKKFVAVGGENLHAAESLCANFPLMWTASRTAKKKKLRGCRSFRGSFRTFRVRSSSNRVGGYGEIPSGEG
jgi:hypothetical protein